MLAKLEIAVTTLEEAIAAQEGGANSVELSYDLARHGLTPEYSLIQAVRDALTIDLHVIVRPHDRDFVYTEAEADLILQQTRDIAAMGVTGVVFGAQLADGNLDIRLIKRVHKVAGAVPVTLHRAIDSARNAEQALSKLGGIIPRVLTSGPAKTAWEGRQGLRQWQGAFGGQMRFVAAGGIKMAFVRSLVMSTGVPEVHCGSAARVDGIVKVAQVAALKATLT